MVRNGSTKYCELADLRRVHTPYTSTSVVPAHFGAAAGGCNGRGGFKRSVGLSWSIHTRMHVHAVGTLGAAPAFFGEPNHYFSKGRRRQIGIGRRPAAGGRRAGRSCSGIGLVGRAGTWGLGSNSKGWRARAQNNGPRTGQRNAIFLAYSVIRQCL